MNIRYQFIKLFPFFRCIYSTRSIKFGEEMDSLVYSRILLFRASLSFQLGHTRTSFQLSSQPVTSGPFYPLPPLRFYRFLKLRVISMVLLFHYIAGLFTNYKAKFNK